MKAIWVRLKGLWVRVHFRIPHYHELHHKAEHAFHGSYLGAEAIVGHGILAWLAGGSFILLVIGIFLHYEEA